MAEAAPAIMAISAIIGAGTAAYSAYSQAEAAEDAKKIGEQNAALARAETEEEARRLEKEQERTAGLARARAFASGVDPESMSTQLFLEDLETTQREELDWLRRSGYSRADIAEEQGELARAKGMAGAYASAGDVFASAPAIYESGQKAEWWK